MTSGNTDIHLLQAVLYILGAIYLQMPVQYNNLARLMFETNTDIGK